MGVPKIGAVLALSGEGEYRRAISAVNAAQRELRSEMKLVTIEFSGQANTAEALTKKQENLGKQREVQAEKIQIYSAALKEAGEQEEKAKAALEASERQYRTAAAELERMKESGSAANEEIQKQEHAVSSAAEELEKSNRTYMSASQDVSKWKTSLNQATVELKNTEQELDTTGKYLKEAKESTKGTAASIDEFGREVDRAKEKVEVFGGVLKAHLASELIASGARKLCSVVSDVAGASLDAGKNFEESMSQVAATMGIANSEAADTTGSFKVLKDAAREAGESTKYSATESAQALNYLALAGYDAEKAAKTLPSVLNLAAAGGMDLAYASDLATDSMAALNLESDEFVGFSDKMAVTAQKSNTSIAQLGEAILQIGGTAKMLAGGTIELNTELGILADNGIKGAEGGTMLRNVLKNLTSPTAAASAAMEAYGIHVYDAEGKMRPLNETLKDLDRALSGLSDQDRANVMNAIFDSRTLKGAEALIANCGERFDELSGYISDADGAAGAMAETMSDNLAGELRTLSSTAESTGITLYSKFDESFKNITRSASKELGKVNQQLQTGNLGKSMDRLAGQFEIVTEAALDFGMDALPCVIDGMSFILENGGEIVSVLAGIGAGMGAFKAATYVQETVEAIQAFKISTEGASTAQAALNVVVKANPYVLLATAIAAAGVALVTYAVVSSDAKTETEKLNREIWETVKNNKDFNSNVAEGIRSMKENRTAQEQSAETARRLTTELTELNSKERLTTEEKMRMRSVVAQLNQIMPDLNLTINEQTGYLEQNNEEVQRLAEKYAELARAQYYQEEITQIVEQQCAAEDELTDLMSKREEALVSISQAQEALNGYLKEQNISLEELNEQISKGTAEGGSYVYAVATSEEALANLDRQIEETKGTLEMLGEEYSQTSQKISDHSGIDETSEAVGGMAAGTADAAGLIGEQADEIKRSFGEMGESIREAVREQMDIFSEYEKQNSISGEKILSNMDSQVQGMKDWGDNLSELAGRADENGMLISQGLLEHLAGLGPEGAAYVQAFAEMTDEELKRANELWAESVSLPDTIAEQFEETGANMVAGLTQGIENNVPVVNEAMEKAGEGLVKTANTSTGCQSPSKKTRETGKNLMEGLSMGIKNNQKMVTVSMSEVSNATLVTARTQLSSAVASQIGLQFSEGLANGIRSGKSTVINAAVEVARASIAAAKAELGIHSPSKVTEEMGGYYMDGWVRGIQAKTQNLKDAVQGALYDSMIQEAEPPGMRPGVSASYGEPTGQAVGTVQIYIQPQQMTDSELDRTFEYVNERFGTAL